MLYIMPSCSDSSPGILKKNIQRVAAIEKQGVEVKGLFFSKDEKENKNINTSIEKIEYSNNYPLNKTPYLCRFTPAYQQKKHIDAINNVVNRYLNNKTKPFIYLRYPGASRFALRMLKNWQRKGVQFCIEMNGKEEAFYLRQLNENPQDIFAKHYLNCEQKYAQAMMKLADLVVGVSHEIAGFYGANTPTYILSNGFDVNSVKVRQGMLTSEEPINFALISGSPNYWNGADRYINAFKTYDGTRKVTLHLVGSFKPAYLKRLSGNIIQHGMLNKEQLDQLMQNMHVGLGSCSLFRVGLSEGCVLKIREYLSRGLPVVLGYQDTDLNFGKNLDFVHNISANESSVNVQEVINWTVELYKKYNTLHQDIRNFAKSTFSYENKMRAFVNYLKEHQLI